MIPINPFQFLRLMAQLCKTCNCLYMSVKIIFIRNKNIDSTPHCSCFVQVFQTKEKSVQYKILSGLIMDMIYI